MKELRYIGNNQPKGMIVDVEEEDVERLLKEGNYEEVKLTYPKFKKREVKNVSNIRKSTKRF